jgi:hypothetical protein
MSSSVPIPFWTVLHESVLFIAFSILRYALINPRYHEREKERMMVILLCFTRMKTAQCESNRKLHQIGEDGHEIQPFAVLN